MGAGPGPLAWTVVAQGWSDDGGVAVPILAEGDPSLAVAVVDTGSADGVRGVTVGHAGYGAALVFRYQDPQNYWSLRLAPGLGLQLIKQVQGTETVVDYLLSSNAADGLRFGVVLHGEIIEVWSDGHRATTAYVDPDLAGATRAGIGALLPGDGSQPATIDRFEEGPG